MADPEIGGTEPVAVEVEEGKMYWWCTCGRSGNQPFCDGSHKDTDFIPQGWGSAEDGESLPVRVQTNRKSALL